MTDGIITMAYLGASILFILALGGLSHQETARKGNFYGMLGMGVALIATIIGIVTANCCCKRRVWVLPKRLQRSRYLWQQR